MGACTLLLFAGHSTTAGLLTSGARLLLDTPSALAALQADASLWPTAVDELLRMEGPAKLMVRRALVDVDIDGTTILAGDTVWL